jgi:hypothetical protein
MASGSGASGLKSLESTNMNRVSIRTLVLLLATAGTAIAGQSGDSTSSFSGACLLLVTNETLAEGANVVPWGQTLYDQGGWSNLVANPTRLTVPSGVSYVVVDMGGALEAVAGQFNIRDDINGSDSLAIQSRQMTREGGYIVLAASTPALPVAAGDYFEYVAGSEGAATLMQSPNTYFCIRSVR